MSDTNPFNSIKLPLREIQCPSCKDGFLIECALICMPCVMCGYTYRQLVEDTLFPIVEESSLPEDTKIYTARDFWEGEPEQDCPT